MVASICNSLRLIIALSQPDIAFPLKRLSLNSSVNEIYDLHRELRTQFIRKAYRVDTVLLCDW
jgi:hypothetical protein